MEKVEQFVPNPLRCYRCQKYGHHEDSCRGRKVCGKCGQRDPGHHMNECEFPYKCTNCGGDHPVYARSCHIWRREKEILAVKYKNNIPYYETQKNVYLLPSSPTRKKWNKIWGNGEKINSAWPEWLGKLY